jgi:predicted dehydrogenase
MACEALRTGKAVFVEKPLAVDPQQLSAIRATVEETGNDRLMVGFNRRFAPLLGELRGLWGPLAGPLQLRYDVNAGQLEADSWYRSQEQGSRIVGEGCHFIDTASWWLGGDPVDVVAISTPGDPDDAVLNLTYPDGSIVTISYLTRGDARYPKEVLQVFGQRQVARFHNFQAWELWRDGKRRSKRSRAGIDKGQRRQVDAFVRAVVSGEAMPIALASLFATTSATFAAGHSMASRGVELVTAIDLDAAGVPHDGAVT